MSTISETDIKKKIQSIEKGCPIEILYTDSSKKRGDFITFYGNIAYFNIDDDVLELNFENYSSYGINDIIIDNKTQTMVKDDLSKLEDELIQDTNFVIDDSVIETGVREIEKEL